MGMVLEVTATQAACLLEFGAFGGLAVCGSERETGFHFENVAP